MASTMSLQTSTHVLLYPRHTLTFSFCKKKTVLQCPYSVKAVLNGDRYKCTSFKAIKSLRNPKYVQLLCHDAAVAYCKSPFCLSGSFHRCVIEQTTGLEHIIARRCGADVSNRDSATGAEETSYYKLFSEIKLPSMSPSSTPSKSPSSSPSQSSSTTPTPSVSPSVSSSASASVSASVSATSSPSASATMSTSPSASVSISASPSASERPACGSIVGQSCSASCVTGGTQIFGYQCPNTQQCCREPDCRIESGQSCSSSCFSKDLERKDLFCQPGHRCCKLPACGTIPGQNCFKTCTNGAMQQDSFFCKGVRHCCLSPSCVSKPEQACALSCKHSALEVTDFCGKDQVCCKNSNANTQTKAGTEGDREPKSAPTTAAMTDSSAYEDDDGSNSCTDADGKCTKNGCRSGTEVDSNACQYNEKCCIAFGPAKCKGICISKYNECDGMTKPEGCTKSTVCCEKN
eukprot:IDg9763t1